MGRNGFLKKLQGTIIRRGNGYQVIKKPTYFPKFFWVSGLFQSLYSIPENSFPNSLSGDCLNILLEPSQISSQGSESA